MTSIEIELMSAEVDKEMLALENGYLSDLYYGRITEFMFESEEESEKGSTGLVGFIKRLIQAVKDFFKKIFGGSEEVKTIQEDKYTKTLNALKEAADKGEKVKVANFKGIDKSVREMCKYIDGTLSVFIHDLEKGVQLTTVSKVMKTFEKRLNEYNDALSKYKNPDNMVEANANEAYKWYKENMSSNGVAGTLKESLERIDNATKVMDRISRSAVLKGQDVGLNLYPESTRHIFKNAITNIKGSGVIVKHALASITAAAVTTVGSVKAVKNGEGVNGVVEAGKKGNMASKAVKNLADATSKKEMYELRADEVD